MLYCFVIYEKTKEVFLEKIDLSLDENEIGVVIYNDKLLLTNSEETTLILMDGDEKVDKFLSTFGFDKINNLITYEDINPKFSFDNKYSISNLNLKNIKGNGYNLKIILHNYTFCIYESGDTSDCTFIYLKNEDNNIDINDQNKAVFFKKSEQVSEKLYTKWIDSYALDDISYTIIKVTFDNYNIINVPIQF